MSLGTIHSPRAPGEGQQVTNFDHCLHIVMVIGNNLYKKWCKKLHLGNNSILLSILTVFSILSRFAPYYSSLPRTVWFIFCLWSIDLSSPQFQQVTCSSHCISEVWLQPSDSLQQDLVHAPRVRTNLPLVWYVQKVC